MQTVSAVTLDATDRRMLRALQADGRMSNADLARAVNLSESASLRRLRALENREIDAGPQADLFASLPADEPEMPGHPVLGALAAIDPDALTPREALEALYELKRLSA